MTDYHSAKMEQLLEELPGPWKNQDADVNLDQDRYELKLTEAAAIEINLYEGELSIREAEGIVERVNTCRGLEPDYIEEYWEETLTDAAENVGIETAEMEEFELNYS